MNKKVSTLVAALMAAGALVLPKDVFAQLSYANGGSYTAVSATNQNFSELTTEGKEFFIVFNHEGTDYVACVQNVEGTVKLVSKKFSEAGVSDCVIISKNGSNYTLSNGVDKLEYLSNSEGQWGNTSFPITTISSEGNEVVINAGSDGSISRTGSTIIMNQSADKKLDAKIVDDDVISGEKYVSELTYYYGGSEVKDGALLVLTQNGKALEDSTEKGIATLEDYDSENNAQVWKLVIVNDKTGEAHFQNVKTGKKLQLDNESAYVSINLEGNATDGWTMPTPNATIEIPAGNIAGIGVGKYISFAKAKEASVTSETDLNSWYNGKGFNFAANGKDVQGNLFGGDKVIFSYTLLKDGYTIEAQGGNDVTIPAGTYFFTDVKFLNGVGAADAKVDDDNEFAKNIDWLNSTLIAVSSTKASEATDSDRKAGEGFELVEVLGSDFNFQVDGDKAQGDDVAINNAAFTVIKQASQSYPYALSLANFYYQAEGSDYATVDQKLVKDNKLKVAVESYTNSGVTTNLVVSKVSSTNIYAFKFDNSAVLNTRTLLNETKEAAVYTIKFVKGVEADKNLMDKYLTVGLNDAKNDFQWEAKPAAIFDASMPIFQWVITNVSDGTKNSDGEMEYKSVTFTNRETGEYFTTQLFAEGDGLYSMSTEELTGSAKVTPFTVEDKPAQNTYAVKAETSVGVTSNVLIQLDKVEVDEYAGFLNVEDGEIRTMAFARDKYTTSNRLFAAVVADDDSRELNADDEFATEVSDAAQWKLMKIEEKEISRTFVYNNTSTKSADRVANGDKLKAYVYALRLVEDGSETEYFLANDATDNDRALATNDAVNSSEDLKNDADVKFLIKENVDGSVSLIKYDATSTMANSVVAPDDTKKSLDATYNTDDKEYQYAFSNVNNEYVYLSSSESNDVRVYLDDEHKEISWPAESGHVTLLSEMSNYVNMNENREGIEVAENDANSYYLHVTDKNAVVPSFYLSLGKGEGSNASSERMFMFNPVDSVNYQVAEGEYDTKYQWSEENRKLMFKAATMNESADTLSTTIKGEVKKVAMKADNNNKDVFGGLNRFKFQIVETPDADGYYYIRQTKADVNGATTQYLGSINSKMTFVDKTSAMKFHIESVEAPTSNEGVSATEVKVVAQDGAVVVKNAAGKNVVVSTILGQVVANEVLTSDNATINVPAGIVVVAVEGESFKVNVK